MGTKCEDRMHVRVHLGKYGKTLFKNESESGSMMKRVSMCLRSRCHIAKRIWEDTKVMLRQPSR